MDTKRNLCCLENSSHVTSSRSTSSFTPSTSLLSACTRASEEADEPLIVASTSSRVAVAPSVSPLVFCSTASSIACKWTHQKRQKKGKIGQVERLKTKKIVVQIHHHSGNPEQTWAQSDYCYLQHHPKAFTGRTFTGTNTKQDFHLSVLHTVPIASLWYWHF